MSSGIVGQRGDSLESDHGFAEPVKRHDPFVVCGPQTREEFCRDGKEGNVLDIWVVLWVIRHEVVDVVVVLPPTEAQSAYPVCNKSSQNTIRDVVARNPGMPGVVCDD